MAYGNRTSVWTFVAFIPATIGTVLTVIATTTHYWIESFTERRTGVNSMGLWEICFGQDFAAPWYVQDELGRRYADCNYLLSYELRTLRSWLFTGRGARKHCCCKQMTVVMTFSSMQFICVCVFVT